MGSRMTVGNAEEESATDDDAEKGRRGRREERGEWNACRVPGRIGGKHRA